MCYDEKSKTKQKLKQIKEIVENRSWSITNEKTH